MSIQTPPSVDEIEKLTYDALFNDNSLISWIAGIIEQSPGKLYEDKQIYGLKHLIPRKAGYYYVIYQFDGMYGNGGMQEVLLNEDIEQNQIFLRLASEAFRFFGAKRTASLIDELRPKSQKWVEKIRYLDKQNAQESEFGKIWSEVDRYDVIYDRTVRWGKNPYKVLLKDIHKNPAEYVKK